MRVLLTGGAGFIGSHIAHELLKDNSVTFVRILDNLETGFMKNINDILHNPKLEFIKGDIKDINTVRNAFDKITHVCHQAALGSVPRSVADPLSSHNTNVNGFLNILMVAKETGCKRIVYASSSSVYGDNLDSVKLENRIGEQMSPYAITKYIDELYARIFGKLYSLECIGLRYFNVFGPRQNPDGAYAAVIPKFIKSAIAGEQITINGDGEVTRDFTYVQNVVKANILALKTTDSVAFGEIFNVGSNGSYSINDLFEKIVSIVGKSPDKIHGPKRIGDVAHSSANIRKISSILKYQVEIDFETGLEATIEHFNKIYN